jgi:hypothetical protein
MARTFFWCYPWDLEDEGHERALGRLSGEIGVDGISVAAVLDDLTEFRSRAFAGPHTVTRPAAAHFQPASKHYENTRLRPPAAAWMKSRNPLARIADLARQHSLECRARAVCCRNSHLAARQPSAACVDVFGDPIEARLCPSNPDVREYVAALVEDLSTNYPLDAIELADVGFGGGVRSHGSSYTGVSFSSDRGIGIVRDWCFCTSCRQRAQEAGVDVQDVTAAVLEHLGPILRAEPIASATIGDVLGERPCLAAYHHVRCETVRTLVQMVRKRTDKPLWLQAANCVVRSGADPATLRECCDGLIVAPAEESVPLPADDVEQVIRSCGGPTRVEVGTFCHPPHLPDGPALVTFVRRAWQQGFAAIGFSSYGAAPEPCLDWVRQAIRFARRDART